MVRIAIHNRLLECFENGKTELRQRMLLVIYSELFPWGFRRQLSFGEANTCRGFWGRFYRTIPDQQCTNGRSLQDWSWQALSAGVCSGRMCCATLGNVWNSDSDQMQDQGCKVAHEKSAVNFRIIEAAKQYCSLLAHIEAALNVASAIVPQHVLEHMTARESFVV